MTSATDLLTQQYLDTIASRKPIIKQTYDEREQAMRDARAQAQWDQTLQTRLASISAEAAGVELARALGWNAEHLIAIFAAALDDVNYHNEATEARRWIEDSNNA